MAVTADKPAPYAPASAILNLIERRRNRGLPSPIDADVLGRAGVSGSLIPRTLQALQTLELIDETGKPTETFESIRLAPQAEFQKRLTEWLKAVYADVFAFVDPSTDDETAIRDAFRSYQPIGQQTRMVTLFMGLCAAAGLMREKPVSPRTLARPRPSSPQTIKRVTIKKPQKDTASGIPAALTGLLNSLPAEGESWSKSRRDNFVRAFGTVLDFCFPVVENGSEADQQADEELRE